MRYGADMVTTTWRVEHGQRVYLKVVDEHGHTVIVHLAPEEYVALVDDMPPIAGSWHGSSSHLVRWDERDECVAGVDWGGSADDTWTADTNLVESEATTHATDDEAKAACDARLRAAGWVLR